MPSPSPARQRTPTHPPARTHARTHARREWGGPGRAGRCHAPRPRAARARRRAPFPARGLRSRARRGPGLSAGERLPQSSGGRALGTRGAWRAPIGPRGALRGFEASKIRAWGGPWSPVWTRAGPPPRLRASTSLSCPTGGCVVASTGLIKIAPCRYLYTPAFVVGDRWLARWTEWAAATMQLGDSKKCGRKEGGRRSEDVRRSVLGTTWVLPAQRASQDYREKEHLEPVLGAQDTRSSNGFCAGSAVQIMA